MNATSKIHRYDCAEATVTWDAKRCIHAAECVRRLPAVFDPKAKPWIRPEAADLAALAAAVRACPSGALNFAPEPVAPGETAPAGNQATLTANGPTYVRGDLALLTTDGSPAIEDTRIALCRCGASQNKPYCDGSHTKSGFADDGTLRAADAPAATTSAGGRVAIRATANGPIVCTGTLTIIGTDGRTAVAATTFLCRCGHSGNKPYCDGTHAKIGFVA